MADYHRHVDKDEDIEKLDFYEAMRDFKAMFPTLSESLIESVLRSNHGAVDDTIDELLLIATAGAQTGKEPSSASRYNNEHSLSESSSQQEFLDFLSSPSAFSSVSGPNGRISSSARSDKKFFNPPFVGELPLDFLRLECSACLSDSYYESPPPMYDSVVKQPRCSASSVKSNVNAPAKFNSDYARSRTNTTSKSIDAGLRRQSEALKEKMAENEWRRQITNDPELEKYLEDERIAILLQNEEFIVHLKSDRGFLSALERDRQKNVRRVDKASVQKNSQIDFTGHNEVQNCFDEDAFPYTKILVKSNDGEPAFGEKLKFMGKTSKRKFAILARKFTRKKKGVESAIGKSDSYYSDVSLLADADDDKDKDLDFYEVAGYNQPDDDAYNISHTTDLKEGRLFSR